MIDACDSCKGTEYTAENPFVKMCRRRPSDPSDMCCVLAGHWDCFTIIRRPYAPVLPTARHDLGEAKATPEDLERWIEGPDARACGYMFIT